MSHPSSEEQAQIDRLWGLYQKAVHDLNQANILIRRLSEGPLETSAVISETPSNPIGPKMVIGIVKCPKCGQLMEVEK